MFYSQPINFVPISEKTPQDGKIAKIESKEKIDEILKTHNFIKKKKKMIQKAKFGSQAILKSVLEGIQNYEGIIQKWV